MNEGAGVDDPDIERPWHECPFERKLLPLYTRERKTGKKERKKEGKKKKIKAVATNSWESAAATTAAAAAAAAAANSSQAPTESEREE